MASIPPFIRKGISEQFRYLQNYQASGQNTQAVDSPGTQTFQAPASDAITLSPYQLSAVQNAAWQRGVHDAFRFAFQYYQQHFSPSAFLVYHPEFARIGLDPPKKTDT